MARKRSIGVVALIGSADANQAAVLQVRAMSDSYPGCSQVTFHGRVAEDETLKSALRRESREELAELFRRANVPVPSDLASMIDAPPGPLRVEGRERTQKEHVVSLSLTLHDSRVRERIRPLVDAGIVRIVTRDDLQRIITIDPKNPEYKQHGVEAGLIAMFADERRVLEHVLSPRG